MALCCLGGVTAPHLQLSRPTHNSQRRRRQAKKKRGNERVACSADRRKTETEFLAPSQVSRQVGHTPFFFRTCCFFFSGKKSLRVEMSTRGGGGEGGREGLYRSGCVKISAINFPNTRRRRKVSSCEYLHKFKPEFLPTFQGGKNSTAVFHMNKSTAQNTSRGTSDTYRRFPNSIPFFAPSPSTSTSPSVNRPLP